MADDTLPLLKGTLDLLVMKTLSWGPRHGFGISQWLEQRSDGEVEIDDSALYHALHRLEERGLVDAAWGITENNRKARYYRLTAAGTSRLRAESDTWERYSRVVGRILAFAPRTT
jgi:transcriptional regulator